MGRPEKFQPHEVIAALRDNYGLVYETAQQLRCDPHTVRRYIRTYASVRAEAKEQDARLADLGEKTLIECVLERQPWAVATLLKAKATDRGYGDKTRHEITGADGGPIRHEHRIDLAAYREYFQRLDAARDGPALPDRLGGAEPLDPPHADGHASALPDGYDP